MKVRNVVIRNHYTTIHRKREGNPRAPCLRFQPVDKFVNGLQYLPTKLGGIWDFLARTV